MGRRALSLAAIILWLGAGIAFAVLGVRSIRVERESSIAALRNHPLLGEPDAFQALAGGEVVLRAESPSGVHLRGGASDQTAYLLDGIPVFSPFHSAGVDPVPKPLAAGPRNCGQLESAAPASVITSESNSALMMLSV